MIGFWAYTKTFDTLYELSAYWKGWLSVVKVVVVIVVDLLLLSLPCWPLSFIILVFRSAEASTALAVRSLPTGSLVENHQG
jgi:hypothetical protein